MISFAFHSPQTVPEAAALLGSVSDSMPFAGGMTLLPTIKQRLAAPAALVDLSKIPQLSGIAVEGHTLVIGAMARHVDVAESARVRNSIPLLATLAADIGDPAVRNRGTIGGSIANNDPSADYPAAVLALAATIVTDRRAIAADSFFTGLFETALEPGEVITAVRFPIPSAGELLKGYRAGLFTPRDVIEDVIAALEQIDASCNVVVTSTYDQARAAADQATRARASGGPQGRMAGVPVSIKDLVYVAGVPAFGGAPINKDLVPTVDAAAVTALKSAGAIITCKTTTCESGYKLTADSPVSGITRNPWNRERTSGGLRRRARAGGCG